MKTHDPLRILIAEDIPSDAELAERELRNDGILFTSTRVDTKEEFLKALEEFRPDLIISDYAMPEFDGMQALQLSLTRDPHLPFILLTGSMNEETAVACMKAGATDYVIKEHIARLPLAVKGALEQQKVRLEKNQSEKELFAIYENAPLIMVLMDGERRLHKVNGCATAFANRSADAMRRMRCGEALGCLTALASPEGCGFGERCEQCIIRRSVAETLETGKNIHHVEGTLSYRTEQRAGKMTFLLSTTKLHFRRQPLVLMTLLDITERKQAEEELYTSEERFKTIFNQSPLGVALIDSMTGHICMANSMFVMIAGKTMEETVHIDWMSITHPDDVREVLDNIALLNAGKIKRSQMQIRYLRPNGSIVWISMTIAPLAVEDNLHPLHLCMIEEITKRKQAEETLRDTETRYRLLFEHSPDGILIIDPATARALEFNETAHRQLGYSREEFSGLSIFDLEAAETPEETRSRIAQCIHEGRVDFETQQRTRQGEIKNIHVTAQSIEILGQSVYHCIWRDITTRKQAEEDLRKTEETYRLVVDNMADVITVMDLNLRFTYVSPSVIRLRGYTAEEVMAQTLEQIMTHESLQIVARVFEEELKLEASGTADLGRTRILELEEYKKDGCTVWLENHLSSFRDKEKKLVGIIASSHDITVRKRTEKQLQDTFESLRKAIGVTIQVMVSAVEKRDPYTAGHQSRSANLARAIATDMGLPREKVDAIRMAGSIHDIGKLSIPAEILSKPTKLSEIEFSLIKEHARQGFEILQGVESPWPLAEMVYQHHERMNGSGYPRNLKGDDILLEARILGVADVVEAIASHRPYRPALGIDAALEEILKNRGILYDPGVTDACLRLFQERGYSLH